MIQYQQECLKTESTSWHEPNRRLLHAAMGLVTETAELMSYEGVENYLEELGDVMWYVAVGCATLEVTIEEAMEACHDFEAQDPVVDLLLDAADILDRVKKAIFYGRDLDLSQIVYRLGRIAINVDTLAEGVDSTLDKVMELNLAKLRRRYNKGAFSEAEAIERDVKHEMAVYS